MTDQRNGELLNVEFVTGTNICMRTASAMGNQYAFEGTISEDGESIKGAWVSPGGGGGKLNASPNFTRSE
jgi:hypothetical protein